MSKFMPERTILQARKGLCMDVKNTGKVLILSATESFLAKSLISKLKDAGINAGFALSDIKTIERQTAEVSLIILFLSDELEAVPETLVYLKDLVLDRELGLILIGEPEQY